MREVPGFVDDRLTVGHALVATTIYALKHSIDLSGDIANCLFRKVRFDLVNSFNQFSAIEFLLLIAESKNERRNQLKTGC
jgi:hypothetical protein